MYIIENSYNVYIQYTDCQLVQCMIAFGMMHQRSSIRGAVIVHSTPPYGSYNYCRCESTLSGTALRSSIVSASIVSMPVHRSYFDQYFFYTIFLYVTYLTKYKQENI